MRAYVRALAEETEHNGTNYIVYNILKGNTCYVFLITINNKFKFALCTGNT